MARATQSFSLYAQQFGRVLRPMEGKECGWILDHVGNVMRHNGPPDCPRAWSLDRRERRSVAVEVETIRICGNKACYRPFERFLTACPFCGWRPIPAERSEPRFVDGDLHELDPEVLAAMRGERDRIDRPMQDVRRGLEQSGKSFIVAQGAAKQHERRQHAQAGLRFAISWWSGFQGDRSQSEQYRRFYHKFGIDVMTAQTLGKADAESLRARIMETLKSEVG